ncbi:MAG: hypothetical protein IKR31_09150 [Prevotella sp.]|nr:hypothetical protein [Prevotella sp.]
MKRILKNTIATLALLLWFTEAGAGGIVNVVQTLNGEPTTCALGVQPVVNDDGLCTLSITDISSPYSVAGVTAIRLMGGENAQSRNLAPTIDHVKLDVTKVEEDVYTFQMPEEPYDVEVTVDFTYRTFGLKVNGIEVTGDILLDILQAQDEDSSLVYNGKGVLILKNPQDPVTVESSLGQDLTIYIKGNGNVLQSVTTTGIGERLFISTDPNKPGTLTLKAAEGKDQVIENFPSIELLEGLAWLNGSAVTKEAVIGVYIQPLVEEKTIEPDGDELDPEKLDEEEIVKTEDETTVINKVVEDILYTLTIEDKEGAAIPIYEEEGDEGKGAVILNTSITKEDMEDALKEEPGTDDFAKTYEGLTLKVAAGSGVIVLDVDVPDGSILMVKIGEEDAVEITTSGLVQIPYVCQEATFVYIYNGTPQESLARGTHRLKIRTAPVRMRSVKVQPAVVQESVDPEDDAAPQVLLDETSDGDITGGVYSPASTDITTLADDLFEGKTENLSTIDLSKTSVKDVEVDRENGPFKGVSAQTFIFLPAGNTVKDGEPNVVIGGVCANMQLTDSDTPFAPAIDFGAQKATLGRDFIEGRTSTVFLPFDLDKGSAAELGHFYTFKGVNATTGDADVEEIDFDEVDGLAANVPYIFKKSSEGKITVNNVTVRIDKPVSAELIGTYELIKWTSELLTEKENEGKFIYGYAAVAEDESNIAAGEFVRVGAGAFIKPYRAYLELTQSYGARIQINWLDDDATGIVDVKSKTRADGWYTIDGRRLMKSPASKGLYIHNGKKTIVNK